MIKKHPERFGNVDLSKVEIDLSGQNLEDYWFDIMQRDWNKRELLFVGEAKSEWKEWRPYSMLGEAEQDVKGHMENAISRIKELEKVDKLEESGWAITRKGYVFAMHFVSGEVKIVWAEVDLNDIVERG